MEDNDKINENNEIRDEDSRNSVNSQDLDLFTCGCCFSDEIPISDVITCSDGHIFCVQCVTKVTASHLATRRFVFCMDTTSKCKGVFLLKEIEKFKDKVVASNYSNMIARKYIHHAKVDNFYECHNCSNGAIIEGKSSLIFECSACGKGTCLDCKMEKHEDKKCPVYKKKYKQEIESTATVVIVCKCGDRFVKGDDSSCNKITCPTCARIYCYICGEKLRKIDGYNHFRTTPGGENNQTSTCPLWKGIPLRYKKLHISLPRYNIVKRFTRFLSRNKSIKV